MAALFFKTFPKPTRAKPASGDKSKSPEGYNDTDVTVPGLCVSRDRTGMARPRPPPLMSRFHGNRLMAPARS